MTQEIPELDIVNDIITREVFIAFDNYLDFKNFSEAISEFCQLHTVEPNIIEKISRDYSPNNANFIFFGLSDDQVELDIVQNLILTYNGSAKLFIEHLSHPRFRG
jgi:hypothetical protein